MSDRHPVRGVVRALLLLLMVNAALRASDEAPQPFPDMAPTVGTLLDRDYYDKTRFHPRTMVERALRALEGARAGIDTRWLDGRIALQMAERTIDIPAAEPQSLADAMAILERVRTAVEQQGIEWSAKERRDLAYDLLNGALTSLDPHTLILPPDPADDFAQDIAGEFFGIGAFLNQEDGVISIERVMPGLPAERGGVEDGDIILGIDGEKTVGLSLPQAVRRIKGPKGTTVVLTVERKGEPKPLDLAITRDLVQVVTMRSWREDDIGYVRMDEFNANTARDLWHEMQVLQERGDGAPLAGFVLDLRGNGGGLLEQARLISEFFLARNREIVRTVTVDGEPHIYTSSARPNKPLQDLPMLVLTGGGSASAAEILAGALQCNDRAVVVGSTTFGKGSVQSIRPLRDNSKLKLTIQEYQLRNGVSIQDVGITPDVVFMRHSTREDGRIDLVPLTGMREVDDEFALAARNTYRHQAAYHLGWLASYETKEQARQSSISSRDFTPDQEARLAMSLLAGALAQPEAPEALAQARKAEALRPALVELLARPVAERAEREAQRLAEVLAARTPAVAWGPDAAQPDAITVTYDGPPAVRCGEHATLTFTVTNHAAADAGRLYGIVRGLRAAASHRPDAAGPFWEHEVAIGRVAGDGSTQAKLEVDVPPRWHAGEERFVLELHRDGEPQALAATPVSLRVQERPRPHFSYRWQLEGGDGTLVTDQAATIAMTIVNDGEGDAAPVNVYVFKDNDPYVQLGEGRWKLPPLAAGATTDIRVPVMVVGELKRAGKPVPFSGDAVKLVVRVEERFDDKVDARYRATLLHTLAIPVGKPVAGAAIVQPTLSLATLETLPGDKAHLAVRVKDDNLRYVALFQDEDKVDLELASSLHDGVYETTVQLKPGVNSLRVLAADADEVDEMLPLRVWGPDPAPEPTAESATTAAAPAPAPASDALIP